MLFFNESLVLIKTGHQLRGLRHHAVENVNTDREVSTVNERSLAFLNNAPDLSLVLFPTGGSLYQGHPLEGAAFAYSVVTALPTEKSIAASWPRNAAATRREFAPHRETSKSLQSHHPAPPNARLIGPWHQTRLEPASSQCSFSKRVNGKVKNGPYQ